MPIDGIIILDNTGRPFIQSGFRSTSPAYALLHVDAFNHAQAKANRPGDIDPAILVPPYGPSSSPSACCHVKCGDMRFLCPVSGDVDPLYAFAFLQAFIDILKEYFGTVSAATLKEHFDVVYQLLEETLDSGGYPLTTSTNALRDIVTPPSLLSKLLSVAGANINTSLSSSLSGSTGGSSGGPFSSPIPWRKAGLKYSSNEIYFDIVEELKAIVNRHGTALSSNVWGKIETNAKLSGTPDLLLTFTNAHLLTDCAFHPCVRLQRWTRDKSLSFVPPDGRFTLMDYRFSPNASTTSASTSSIAILKDLIPVPFTMRSSVELVDSPTATFEFTFTPRLPGRPLENVNIEMYLGEGAGSVKCTATRGGSGSGFGGNAGAAGSGNDLRATSWGFDPKRRVLRWEIATAPPSSSWTLRGSFSTSTLPVPRPSHALRVRFDVPSHTFSALKVDQLRLSSEVYKPHKYVRGKSSGDVEWRW